jgi:3-oxoacyl-[acyl-carrier protein] reductase
MGQLDGRVALVTGGGRGIGRGISELLASEGGSVAVNYRRDRDAAEATVAAIETAGGVARAYQASIDDPDEDGRMVDEVVADFGFVDIVVNNGGVASRGMSVADTDPSEVGRVIGVHAVGAHHLCRLVLPSMRTRPRGDIVMISSVATAHFAGNGAPYNMAKAAGIHVNVVAPGLVDTDMGERLMKATAGVTDLRTLDASSPFGHVCQPIDVARVVLWLCSEGAGYVTSQRIRCDGGGTALRY